MAVIVSERPQFSQFSLATLPVSEDIPAFTVIAMVGDGSGKVKKCTAADMPIGISHRHQSTPNESVSFAQSGIAWGIAAVAIPAEGVPLYSNGDGQLVLTGTNIVGIAASTAAAGENVSVKLRV